MTMHDPPILYNVLIMMRKMQNVLGAVHAKGKPAFIPARLLASWVWSTHLVGDGLAIVAELRQLVAHERLVLGVRGHRAGTDGLDGVRRWRGSVGAGGAKQGKVPCGWSDVGR